MSSGLLDETGQPLSSGFPVLATDPWGIVHAFWPQLPRQDDSQNGIMYYSRWDGSSWSEPIDVLFMKGRPMRSPSVVADETGRIHLAWTAGAQGPVWYSSAPAFQAGSAQAWSDPVQVSELNARGFGLAVDSAGRCHVAFCTGGDQRCYYSASSEEGVWTSAVSLYAPCQYCVARVAMDGHGRIHTVFGSQSTGGQEMYYARSEDGGQTWLAEELDHVDDRFGENYGPSWGTVIASGEAQVHVVWFGAPAGQRWHRWSNDGGKTWSAAEQISPDHRGLTLPVAAAFDSAGALHLVSMGWRDTAGRPSGAFHFVWQRGSWSEPQLIGSRSDWDAEYSALTIKGGNLLVAAWTDKQGPKGSFQIWASTLKADAPAVEPLPLTTSALPTPTALQSARMSGPRRRRRASRCCRAHSSCHGSICGRAWSSDLTQSGWLPDLLGVLPPLVLLILVLFVRMSRQRAGR